MAAGNETQFNAEDRDILTKYVSDSYYSIMNEYLRMGESESDEYNKLFRKLKDDGYKVSKEQIAKDVKKLIKLFEKAPRVQEGKVLTVYRGTKHPVYELNKEVQEKGFFSTSKDRKTSETYANEDTNCCLYVLNIQEGVPYLDVDNILVGRLQEYEVLLPPNIIVNTKSVNETNKIKEYTADVHLNPKDKLDYQRRRRIETGAVDEESVDEKQVDEEPVDEKQVDEESVRIKEATDRIKDAIKEHEDVEGVRPADFDDIKNMYLTVSKEDEDLYRQIFKELQQNGGKRRKKTREKRRRKTKRVNMRKIGGRKNRRGRKSKRRNKSGTKKTGKTRRV